MHENAADVAYHKQKGDHMKDAQLKETPIMALRILQKRRAVAQRVNQVEPKNVRYHKDDRQELRCLPKLLLWRICREIRH